MVLEVARGMGDRETAFFLDGPQNGSFEPREGKIEGVFGLGVGKLVFIGVAVLGGLGDGGATGVGKTEDFGNFVETFADGVVVGGADNLKIVVFFHV